MLLLLLLLLAAQESPAEESFASELSMVEMKDTSSMLADIDSEVSFMVSAGGHIPGLRLFHDVACTLLE